MYFGGKTYEVILGFPQSNYCGACHHVPANFMPVPLICTNHCR